MTQQYRACVRSKDFEVEFEAPEKEWVEDKLSEYFPDSRKGRPSMAQLRRVSPDRGHIEQNDAGDVLEDDAREWSSTLGRIVDAIHESERFDSVNDTILKNRDQLPRILMCLYFAEENGVKSLSSTQIERLTDELGVRIASQNVAKVIRKRARQFLTTDGVRGRGKRLAYRLNRRGHDEFERLLNGSR